MRLSSVPSMTLVLAIAAVASSSTDAEAAPITLVQYSFHDGTQNTDAPTTLAAGVSAPSLSIGSGATTRGFVGTAVFRFAEPMNSNNGSNIDSAGADLTDYFGFTFATADPTQKDLQVTGFSFLYASDQSGPRRYQARFSLDGFATAGTTFAAGEIVPNAAAVLSSTDLSGYASLQDIDGPVSIRIYMWGALASTRDGRVDDLTVTGNVVPEPASVAVLGLGALTLGRRQRRRG